MFRGSFQHARRAVAAAGRRLGPAGCTLIAIGLTALQIVGCLIRDTHFWRGQAVEERAPDAVVDRQIRVRLLGRTANKSAKLAVTSRYVLVRAADGMALGEEAGPLEEVTVQPAAAGGLELGGRFVPCDDVVIRPVRDANLVLNGQSYRGLLRVTRAGEVLVFTNLVDVEAYLRGVLRGELPRYFHPEAFRAQCVAARTYVLYKKQNDPLGDDVDVIDDEGSQMYVGVQGEDAVAVDAVESTRGEVCMYGPPGGERLFCTYYSSACGGVSQHVNNVKPRDPAPPPLAGGVACKDCYLARFYRWGPVEVSKTELTRRLTARYPSLRRLGIITELRPKQVTADGRVVRMDLVGSGGKTDTLFGEDFRLSIDPRGRSLKSTNFTIETTKDKFTFKQGKGFGHGVGLCQYGMETKARRGMDYREILRYYYPGCVVKKLY